MSVKRFKPLTPGLRFKVANTFAELTTDKPEKSLLAPLSKSGGRNRDGKMTMRYMGGGHKKMYRVVDFRRDKLDIPATVKTIEYDPNRSAFIALLFYADGEKRSSIPLGSSIHNIELRPGRGGQMVRSAGGSAVLAARDGQYAIIKLPSGETRMVLQTCMATMGALSNEDHFLEISGKAGRSRWLGRRPRVRGVAMNPVDHPMGGGEGRASGGHPRSRNSIPSKGYKTRRGKRPSDRLIIKRRTN
jgi:large subunit ribosomal protein L2